MKCAHHPHNFNILLTNYTLEQKPEQRALIGGGGGFGGGGGGGGAIFEILSVDHSHMDSNQTMLCLSGHCGAIFHGTYVRTISEQRVRIT